MMESLPRLCEFGPFRLDTVRRTLSYQDEAVRLRPKAFDMLELLVRCRGRVVEKSEILDLVWPGTAVEESNLAVNICAIRRALGETPNDHQFIVTVPGRGYQFVAKVHAEIEDAEAESLVGAEEPKGGHALATIGRGDAVALAAKKRRANAPTTGALITLAAAFVLGVALLGVFGQLGTQAAKQGGNHGVEDRQARALYLRGRYLLTIRTHESLQNALMSFQQAIERAPTSAGAYAGLADAYAVMGHFGMIPPRDAYAKATVAVQRALSIDAGSAEAQTSLAYLKHRFEWDWDGAERSFRRAIAADPDYALAHHWYSVFLMTKGRTSEALVEARRAEEIDPVNPLIGANFTDALRLSNLIDLASEQGRRTLEAGPNLWLGRSAAAKSFIIRRDYTRAVAESELAAQLSGRGTFQLSALGVAYANAGRRAAAHAVIAEIDAINTSQYVSAYARVPVLVALGEYELALTWLERAFAEGATQMVFLNSSKSLVPLKTDPRFVSLSRRVALDTGHHRDGTRIQQ